MLLKRILFLLLLLLAVPPVTAQDINLEWYSQSIDGTQQLDLYFFWSRHCPHCTDAVPFVKQLGTQYPWLNIHSLEVTGNQENIERYINMATRLGEKAEAVPAFLFCETMMTGFESAETTGAQLDQLLKHCYGQVLLGHQEKPLTTQETMVTNLPLLGDIESRNIPLFVLTLVLAGLDAFNPCAFFVLLFLLSLLTHVHNRKRMLLVGGVFVLFSGIVYFIFMAAWLNAFMLIKELQAITAIAGIIAVVMALINIKDYFWFRQGVSLSIPEESKPDIYKRVRRLINTASLPSMLLSTVILAAAANSYELLCTAGFPMVYTRTLTLNELSVAQYYLYLLLYNTVYIIPLALIVIVFTFFIGVRNLTEEQGRVLKLLSGIMMLALGVILIAAPEWLQYMKTAFILLAGTVGLTVVIVFISRLKN